MRIKIQNLGALRQAEFSLGEMTILCGDNNTGKTYATYALFGFLYFWRDLFSITVKDEQFNELLAEGVVHIGLADYIKQADKILADGCSAYNKRLHVVFAAPVERFRKTVFEINLDAVDIRPLEQLEQYERRMSSTNAELFSITKSAGSADLVVTLLVEKE